MTNKKQRHEDALNHLRRELTETEERYTRLIDDLKRANQQIEQRANELAAVNRVTAALTNVSDLHASLKIAARELTQVFKTRGSTVTLIDENRKMAEVVAEYFTDPKLPSVLRLPVPMEIPFWKELDEKRTAIVIQNPGEASVLGPVRSVMKDRAVQELLVAPLISRGQLIGNLSVSHEAGRSFAPHEVMLAQTLASPVAQAVENARLFKTVERANEELARLSVTDAVTGLANRRLFHETIETEWRRAQRSNTSISVLMIDIDFFKPFNDYYGHQKGDTCLAKVAAALQKGLKRAGDFVARYGGEEFVVILPNTNEAQARIQGERMCERVRALALPHKKSAAAPVVTISVGCAGELPVLANMSGALIASADRALYEAKRKGRNRVVSASELG